jgi:hypothetical protein
MININNQFSNSKDNHNHHHDERFNDIIISIKYKIKNLFICFKGSKAIHFVNERFKQFTFDSLSVN